MKTLISLILSLSMALSGFFGSFFANPVEFVTKDEFEIFAAVNEVRKEAGVQTLELDKEICRLAGIRANEQSELKGHSRPDGSRFYTVFKENGYEFKSCGENIIIASSFDVERIIDSWYQSESHRKNMCDNRWIKSGIGIYETEEKIYIVQLFAC